MRLSPAHFQKIPDMHSRGQIATIRASTESKLFSNESRGTTELVRELQLATMQMSKDETGRSLMRRIMLAWVLPLLSLLATSSALNAQTTTVYKAPTGYVSPSLVVTMHFANGGSAILNPVVGPNCYYGMTCGFPAGYVGTYLSYMLPDGSSATLTNFSGTFFPLGSNNYEISGQAAGVDSQSRSVSVDNVQATMHITCRSGRGGGCSKVYTGGTLTLTVGAVVPPPAPTAVPTAASTVVPTPVPGDD